MSGRRVGNPLTVASLPSSRNGRSNATAATTATATTTAIAAAPRSGNRSIASSSQQQSQQQRDSSSGSSSKKKTSEVPFHPKLITAQIIALQCLHYFLLAFCIQVNNVLYSTSITIDRIFTTEYVSLWKRAGWADVTAILLVSLVGSVLLAIIVEKSKKCLDFAVTLFLIHLGLCTLYGGFPVVLDWWIVQVTGTILMVLLGEYLCSLRELSDIPLLQL